MGASYWHRAESSGNHHGDLLVSWMRAALELAAALDFVLCCRKGRGGE